jgi:hypothetical protein
MTFIKTWLHLTIINVINPGKERNLVLYKTKINLKLDTYEKTSTNNVGTIPHYFFLFG